MLMFVTPLPERFFYGRVSRGKPFHSRKIMLAQLSFAMLHMKKSHQFWNNVFWTDEKKWTCLVIMSGAIFDGKKKHHHKHLMPTVKNGGGGVMI